MPESQLFMSSLSRRELARRRPGRSWPRPVLFMAMLAVVVIAALLLAGPGAV